MFKEGELKILWPFYLDALLSPLIYFMPAFMVLYFQNIGLSVFQISLLTSAMGLAVVLFEIPTGAIADIYGRKFSVLLSAFLSGILVIGVFFFKSFLFLLFTFFLLGLAVTFNSGAREAWVTDLVNRRNKKLLQSYFSKVASIDGFALIFSGIIGALMVSRFGLSVIWIFASVSCFVSFFILLFASERFVRRRSHIKGTLRTLVNQSRKSVSYVRKHTFLSLFLAASAFMLIADVFSGDLAWVTLLRKEGMPTAYFGYMWSLMGVVAVLGPLVSMKFAKKNSSRLIIIWSLGLVFLVTLSVFFISGYIFALCVLFSSLFLFYIRRPVERTYFHSFIPSRLRATIGSVESMFLGIVGILVMPLVGLSIDYFGARATILLSSVFIIPAIILYLVSRKKKL